MRRSLSLLFLFGPTLAIQGACGSASATHPSPLDSGTWQNPEAGADAGGDAWAPADSGSGTDSSTPDSGATPDSGPSEGGLPANFPIKHVVVIVKENHTFDNYFGSFPGADGTTTCQTSKGPVPVPTTSAPNITPRDMCHQHSCALADWDNGKMDGWLSDPNASQNGDNLFCQQYREADIPNYWAYARKYALADHFHANVLGPSFPGHTFMLAAQAGWATGNPSNSISTVWGCDEGASDTIPILDHGTCTTSNVFPCFNIPSVPTLLPAGNNWKFYGTTLGGVPLLELWSMFDAIQPIRQTPSQWAHVVNVDDGNAGFLADVQAGTLPAVSWLVPQDTNDEHPGLPLGLGSVCNGENWTVKFVNAIMQNPALWKETAIFFTMDDFGGWYDHVAPPRQYGCDSANPYGLGFRLPLIVMSPYVKQGVYHPVAEQASVVKFILEAFHAPKFLADLDPAAQDKQANDLMDMFDWNQTPLDPLPLTERTCP